MWRSVRSMPTRGASFAEWWATPQRWKYHPNGLLHTLPHSNGVTDTQTIATDGMARPLAIQSAVGNGSPLWSTGSFSFDGAGNITEIGASWFLYDGVSRLKQSAVSTNQNGGGQQFQQSYGFDAFGNLLAMTGTSAQSTPTSASTNRLIGGTYDNAGNLVAWEESSYEYDEFNQMVRMKSGPREWIYVYTVDGERIWQFKVGAEPRFDRWTLRDLGGQVLRIYEVSGGNEWDVDTDYVYRNGSLLAAETRDGERHFHLDHLGTPRLITGPVGGQVSYHAYLPYGGELTNPSQDDVALKFTGHERDLEGDGLDYMRARHCGPEIGRFTSVDPVGGDPRAPQSWNRYPYTRNNPIRFVDPDGEAIETGWDVANVAIGAASLLANIAAGNVGGAIVDAGGLVLDLGATAIPGAPAFAGSSIKAARLAENARRGKAFEKAILKAFELQKNTRGIKSASGSAQFRIPDALTRDLLVEVKGVKQLNLTKQVRDFIDFAADDGRQVVIAVKDSTKISRGFREFIETGQVIIVRVKVE